MRGGWRLGDGRARWAIWCLPTTGLTCQIGAVFVKQRVSNQWLLAAVSRVGRSLGRGDGIWRLPHNSIVCKSSSYVSIPPEHNTYNP